MSSAVSQLDQLVLDLQRRWGTQALYRVQQQTVQRSAYSTGFDTLDQLAGGGVPCGQITEFLGTPTCGMTTIALKLIARTLDASPVYVDLTRTLDPYYAARCGVRLDSLLIACPPPDHALAVLADLIRCRATGLVVVDGTERLSGQRAHPLAPALRQLKQAVVSTSSAVVFLTRLGTSPAARAARDALSPSAALRLRFDREGWLCGDGDVDGCQTHVTVLKSPAAPPGRSITVPVAFAKAI